MRNRLVILATMLWSVMGAAVSAGSPVVVELFTSQGCSSCPPADRILGEIAGRDDVIALGLHVDYWDYIGWKDSFANPAFTERQRAYARAAGERTVYTPQMVVGGRDHVVGSKYMKLSEYIAMHAAKPDRVSVKLRRAGDKVEISAKALGDVPAGMVVQLVTYLPEATVDIRRGENAGRKLTYHNIVRDWVGVGAWNGDSAFTASVRVPDGLKVAVLVQERDAGSILAAAALR